MLAKLDQVRIFYYSERGPQSMISQAAHPAFHRRRRLGHLQQIQKS